MITRRRDISVFTMVHSHVGKQSEREKKSGNMQRYRCEVGQHSLTRRLNEIYISYQMIRAITLSTDKVLLLQYKFEHFFNCFLISCQISLWGRSEEKVEVGCGDNC